MQTYQDCHISFDRKHLTIGNAGIERAWDLSSAAPSATSIRDLRDNREWVAPSVYSDTIRRRDLPLDVPSQVEIDAIQDDFYGISEPHLRMTVNLTYPKAKLVWTHRIWPELPIIMSQFEVVKTSPGGDIGLEPFKDLGFLHLHPADDRMDFFGLAPLHLSYHTVAFISRTDRHDNLVREQTGRLYPKECIRPQGHYLHISDIATPGGGLLAMKISPAPLEQLNYPGFDFSCSGNTLAIVGLGISPQELDSGRSFATYAYAVGVTDGKHQSGEELCYNLERRRKRPDPRRTFSVISNTWGDGNNSDHVDETMFLAEVEVGSGLGLTHCQIDAGWQKGNVGDLNVESNIPKGPYDLDPDFWTIHPQKFPHGMTRITELARSKGLRLGFWFHPDSTNDYGNWRKDSDVIIKMCRDYGFDTVKIDGVAIRSKQAEANFQSFLQSLHLDSGRTLCINLDVTNGLRPGFLYGNEFAGNLFVENRYVLNLSYFPFRTLRNIWHLCRFIPSYRLQMEFVNTEIRSENHAVDPLAPNLFGTEFSCAVVLFANPLCWMEVAQLSKPNRKRVSKLLHAYKPHQEAILCGRVYPIGEEPSGRSWTGLQSVTGPGQGYLLVFRESTDRPTGRFTLRDVKPGARMVIDPIAGRSRIRRLHVNSEGQVGIRLPAERSFALLKYSIS